MAKAKPFTREQRAIAKSLGVTPFALSVLTRHAAGRTDANGGMAGGMLRSAGFLELFERPVASGTSTYTFQRSRITDSGRALVARARAMGW